jgi:DNA-binding IclR family transcriptional regulator
MQEEKNAPKLDSTLSKGLTILEALTDAKSAKGVTELAKELGLTKSNTFRLLQTLRALGYVKHTANRNYAATLKTWQVGRNVIEHMNLREIANEEMHQLSDATGETIYLAVPEGLSVVYINKIDSVKPVRSWNQIGGTAPIHCVGTGKAILAANYTKLRDSIKTRLDRYTDNTLTTIDALDDNVKQTQQNGYAIDNGEYRDRVISFGAAVTLPDREAVAALGISVPDINLPADGRERMGRLVRDAARSVSKRLRNL